VEAVPVHEVWPCDALREAREVLNLCGGHELPPRHTPGLHALEDHRLQVGPRRINGCRVPCWSRPNDHQIFQCRRDCKEQGREPGKGSSAGVSGLRLAAAVIKEVGYPVLPEVKGSSAVES